MTLKGKIGTIASVVLGVFLLIWAESGTTTDVDSPDFMCTQVMGFSQTAQWFGDMSSYRHGTSNRPEGSRMGGASRPENCRRLRCERGQVCTEDGCESLQVGGVCGTEVSYCGSGLICTDGVCQGDPDAVTLFEQQPGIIDSNWQLLWVEGGGIEYWSDPEFDGWNADSPRRNLVSPCERASDEPDRVILTISSAEQTRDIPVAAWRVRIQHAITEVQQQYPGVRQIVLQAVVGVKESRGGRCNVRASRNQSGILEAIQTISEDMVVSGPDLRLDTCGQFIDNLGHFSRTDASMVASQVAEFYR